MCADFGGKRKSQKVSKQGSDRSEAGLRLRHWRPRGKLGGYRDGPDKGRCLVVGT